MKYAAPIIMNGIIKVIINENKSESLPFITIDQISDCCQVLSYSEKKNDTNYSEDDDVFAMFTSNPLGQFR